MLLTTKGRYAVMAMIDLASNTESHKPVTLAAISERQEIDKGYLEQIFIKLKAAGLVAAIRGPGGGYNLVGQLDEIRVSQIMAAVEEDFKLTRCNKVDGEGCLSNKARCRAHHLWEHFENHIYEFLSTVSLADIINKSEFSIKGGVK